MRKLFILCTGLLVCASASAANIYRYAGPDGSTIWDSSIPLESINDGYTILDARGEVLREVPPAPTEAELAERAQQEEARRLAAQEAQAQRAADDMLLRLYGTPEGVARKRDEHILLLDEQLVALGESLENVTSDRDRLAEIVSRKEAAGREAPQATQDQLVFAERERQRLTGQMAALQAEIVAARVQADQDMSRLARLLKR